MSLARSTAYSTAITPVPNTLRLTRDLQSPRQPDRVVGEAWLPRCAAEPSCSTAAILTEPNGRFNQYSVLDSAVSLGYLGIPSAAIPYSKG